jgi:hypothetical protein
LSSSCFAGDFTTTGRRDAENILEYRPGESLDPPIRHLGPGEKKEHLTAEDAKVRRKGRDGVWIAAKPL